MARPIRPSPWIPNLIASASSTRPTIASGTCSGTWPTPTPPVQAERYGRGDRGTEVALKGSRWLLPRLDPNVFPTPDTTISPAGPSWIQIGTEAGFLPAPVVVPNQPITWITDPTRFDVGNVDQHSLLLAPAERADVIVDFSQFAGQTLILYNDAPAAFPARVASYDYYTGDPDLSPAGAPTIAARLRPQHPHHHAGQDRCNGTPAPAFNLTALEYGFQTPRRWFGRVRIRPEPDHRRAGRL